MTLYIVHYSEYDLHILLGAFSTLEKAEAALQKANIKVGNNNGNGAAWIAEHKLDEFNEAVFAQWLGD